MGDVVHYFRAITHTFECGCYPANHLKSTKNVNDVTCKSCLKVINADRKRLLIKPEVDAEKVEFAKAIVGVIPDKKKMEVFKKAEAYLESVKGD